MGDYIDTQLYADKHVMNAYGTNNRMRIRGTVLMFECVLDSLEDYC